MFRAVITHGSEQIESKPFAEIAIAWMYCVRTHQKTCEALDLIDIETGNALGLAYETVAEGLEVSPWLSALGMSADGTGELWGEPFTDEDEPWSYKVERV